MVNMSVEEAQQLREALSWVQTGDLTANQASALEDLARTLEHALQTERPHGIKGAEP
jgi:ribosomal protein S7